jgi:hypothetical protein
VTVAAISAQVAASGPMISWREEPKKKLASSGCMLE